MRTSSDRPTTISGKTAIVTVALVSVGLACFAWWFRYQQGNAAIEFWSADAAQRIRHARQVELLQLTPTSARANDASAQKTKIGELAAISIDGESYAITRRLNVSRAPGLVHARHSLIVDRNFEWTSAGKPPPIWDFAIRFSDGRRHTTVLLDYETRAIKALGGERTVRLSERIVEGMRDYADRQFRSAEASQGPS